MPGEQINMPAEQQNTPEQELNLEQKSPEQRLKNARDKFNQARQRLERQINTSMTQVEAKNQGWFPEIKDKQKNTATQNTESLMQQLNTLGLQIEGKNNALQSADNTNQERTLVIQQLYNELSQQVSALVTELSKITIIETDLLHSTGKLKTTVDLPERATDQRVSSIIDRTKQAILSQVDLMQFERENIQNRIQQLDYLIEEEGKILQYLQEQLQDLENKKKFTADFAQLERNAKYAIGQELGFNSQDSRNSFIMKKNKENASAVIDFNGQEHIVYYRLQNDGQFQWTLNTKGISLAEGKQNLTNQVQETQDKIQFLTTKQSEEQSKLTEVKLPSFSEEVDQHLNNPVQEPTTISSKSTPIRQNQPSATGDYLNRITEEYKNRYGKNTFNTLGTAIRAGQDAWKKDPEAAKKAASEALKRNF